MEALIRGVAFLGLLATTFLLVVAIFVIRSGLPSPGLDSFLSICVFYLLLTRLADELSDFLD